MTRTKFTLMYVLFSAITIAGAAYILNGRWHFALTATMSFLAICAAVAATTFAIHTKGDIPARLLLLYVVGAYGAVLPLGPLTGHDIATVAVLATPGVIITTFMLHLITAKGETP